MPRAEANQTLARQWEMLKQLPTRAPGITAADLTSRLSQLGYPTTKRTIERDLNDLSRLFGIACNDKGTPYGWHWMEGSSLNLPGLSLTDALSLHIVDAALRPLLPAAVLQGLEPRFRQAQDKLAELSAVNEQARWSKKVRAVPAMLPLLPPQIATGVLDTVQNALLGEWQLQVLYARPSERDPVLYTLHPLALVQQGAVSYLAATAFDYPDVRLYAVHRMRSAQVLEQAARQSADFDVDAYIASGAMQFGSGKPIRLKARIDPFLAQLLRETPLAPDQSIGASRFGVHTLTATVPDSWLLRWWLLSHADQAEVMAPKSLRDDLAARISLAADLYNV